MTNLDLDAKIYQRAAADLVAAAKGDDEKAFQQAVVTFAAAIQQSVLEQAAFQQQEAMDSLDATVLAQRGARQLTGEERNYYQKLIEAMNSPNPKQAVTDMDLTLPKTTIDDIFTDLTASHPLLDMIDFQPTGAVVEWLMNTNQNQLATWAPLCAEIVKELTSGFKKLNYSLAKLSAFLPVCKAMLELGPVWMDRYVRTVLGEALLLGLEDGILNGRGQNQNLHEPIGMRKNLDGAVDPNTGYPDKEKVPVTSITPKTWGALRRLLVKLPSGKVRIVGEMIMVVNPLDYESIVAPATTIATPTGYIHGIFPSATKVVQSVVMPEGEAIIGIPSRYFMAAGIGKEGRIEYDDSYHFLEDERMYVVKFYGYGQPKDNTSFLLLDISNMAPIAFPVYITNASEIGGATPAPANNDQNETGETELGGETPEG